MVIYSSSFPQPVWFVLLPAILLSVRNLACPRHPRGFQIRDRRISGEVRAQPGKTPILTHLYPTSCIVMIIECSGAV